MRFHLSYLGCRLNYAEISELECEIVRRGHTLVDDPARADWAIINTCTVTHVAARKSRQAIRALSRRNPLLKVAAIGCYAEMSPQAIADLPSVAITVANSEKEGVIERILALEGDGDGTPPNASPPPIGHHTRAFCKVQDGCDNRCSYCIVTIARGPAISRRPERVISQIQSLVDSGYREVVLTGVNLGSYGRDRGPTATLEQDAGWSLARLVRVVLERTTVERLRLSSLEPWDVDAALIALWPNDRLCRHLHLPLQSGSDAVLRRMKRRQDLAGYARAVADLRAAVPGIAISSDLMVGFPGETEAEHAQSLAFVQAMALTRLHVFRYSKRQGTMAAEMPCQVGPRVSARRAQQMTELGHRLARAFHRGLVGRTVDVLLEDSRKREGTPTWSGLTDTYARVEVRSPEDLRNRMRRVRITSADERGVQGELV